MHSKLTKLLLLIFLTGTSVALAYILLKPKRVDHNGVSTIQNNKTSSIDIENAIKASFFNVYTSLIVTSDGKSINKDIVLVNGAGQKVTLGAVVNKRPKLVFRYSESDCDMCIDSVMAILTKVAGGKKLPDLLIIGNFKTDRNFMIREKYKTHSFPVFNISDGDFGLPIENKNLPFLFVINQDLEATKIFIPFREIPFQTDEYIRYVLSSLKV